MNSKEARILAKSALSEERFYHTECVAKAAHELALHHGVDPESAELAGYLHDIVKERCAADLLQMIESSDIIDLDEIRHCPQVWHAYAGGVYAFRELRLGSEIADAIAHHTTARAGMTKLEMIVFTADYISADRDFSDVGDTRRIAYESLELAVLEIIGWQIERIIERRRCIDINMIRAYNDLILKQRETEDI